MKKLGILCYYLQEEFSFDNFIEISSQLNLDLTKFDTNKSWYKFLISLKNNEDDPIFSEDGESISFSKIGEYYFYHLSLNCPSSSILNNYLSHFELLISLNGILNGFVFDSEDEKWQGTESISIYDFNNKDYSRLPKILGPIGNMIIDTSKNHGRLFWFGRTRIMAVPINFYSSRFLKLIPLIYLKRFGKFTSYEERDSGVYFRLYEETFKSEKNRHVQQNFWRYMKFDNLIEQDWNKYRFKNYPYDVEPSHEMKQLYLG